MYGYSLITLQLRIASYQAMLAICLLFRLQTIVLLYQLPEGWHKDGVNSHRVQLARSIPEASSGAHQVHRANNRKVDGTVLKDTYIHVLICWFHSATPWFV